MENMNDEKLKKLCKLSELSEYELIPDNQRPVPQYNDGENVTNCQSVLGNSDIHADIHADADMDCGKSASSKTGNTGLWDGIGIQAKPLGNKPLWKLADDSRSNSIMSIRKDYEDVIRKVEEMISTA